MMLVHDDLPPLAPQPHDGHTGCGSVDNASDCLRHENDGPILQMMSLQVM